MISLEKTNKLLRMYWIRLFGKKFVTIDEEINSPFNTKVIAYLYKNKLHVYKIEHIPKPPPQHFNCRCTLTNNHPVSMPKKEG